MTTPGQLCTCGHPLHERSTDPLDQVARKAHISGFPEAHIVWLGDAKRIRDEQVEAAYDRGKAHAHWQTSGGHEADGHGSDDGTGNAETPATAAPVPATYEIGGAEW